MSDLALDVKWQEVLHEAEENTLPHCIAIAAPPAYHQEIIEKLARYILGEYKPTHPDLLVIGTMDKPPVIGDTGKPNYEHSTRWLIDNIALKPVEAPFRLGVIMSADKLLLPAANSLLKLAEEPPDHAVLLFLMEDGRLFLPTLKSRSRFITLNVLGIQTAQEMPASYVDFLGFLEKARSEDMDLIIKTLRAWTNYEADRGNYKHAEEIDSLRRIAEAKNLSVPMMCDIIILILLTGDKEHEHILDDLR